MKLLEDLHIYHENYVSILRCLHVFTSSLPKYPLGKQVMYCYMWVLLCFCCCCCCGFDLVVCLGWSFFASNMTSKWRFTLYLLMCCFALSYLKWEIYFLAMDGGWGYVVSSWHGWYLVSQQEGVSRRRQCTDQQKNPHTDFPTCENICMLCRQRTLLCHLLGY